LRIDLAGHTVDQGPVRLWCHAINIETGQPPCERDKTLADLKYVAIEA